MCVLKFLLSANLHLKCQLCPTSACLFHQRASDCHTTGLLPLGQRPFTAIHPLPARSVTEQAIPTVTATPYTRARLQRNCTVCFHLSIIFAVAKKNGNLLVKMLKSINFAANDFRTNKKKNTPYLALTSSSVWQKSQRLL